MVRSHFINDRVLELLRHLEKGRRGFDLFLTFDETNGKPAIELPNLLPHSAKQCSEIGLTHQQDRLLWWCGDFPFYFALLDVPDYQFYVMIEYDVYLTDQDATLLNALADALVSEKHGRVDGLVTRLRRETPQKDHRLYASAFAQFDTTYSSFFPFVALSKPAASYLYAQRKLEALLRPEAAVHCEAFVPSQLLAAGFKCADLELGTAGQLPDGPADHVGPPARHAAQHGGGIRGFRPHAAPGLRRCGIPAADVGPLPGGPAEGMAEDALR